MSDDEHKRAILQDHKWHRISRQRELAKERGFGIIYEHGQRGESIRDYLNQVDTGDVCGVSRLFLLSDQGVHPAAKRRKELLANVRSIYAKGATIFELDSNRHFGTIDEICDTLLQAYEDIANAGRRRKRDSESLGRPALEFSAKQRNLIVRYWRDTVKFATNAEALAALKADHGIDLAPTTAHAKVREWTGSGRSGR